MRIVCIGGGPAGLYFAISAKLRDPRVEVVVSSATSPTTRSAGASCSPTRRSATCGPHDPQTRGGDPRELRLLGRHRRRFATAARSRSGGHGFCGIARKRLLNILQERAAELGVELRFGIEVDDVDALLADADLVVAADGVNSPHPRRAHAERLRPDVDVRTNRFVWLGTRPAARRVHVRLRGDRARADLDPRLPVRASTSTFIVECGRGRLARPRLRPDGRRRRRSRVCEELFAGFLRRAPADARTRPTCAARRSGCSFPRVACERWCSTGNVVLLGDAAHTAHFSIGSGTQAGDGGRDRAGAHRVTAGEPPARGARAATRRRAGSRCCGCRARRATRWSGSSTSSATRSCRRSSSPTPADPQPARQPREPAAARPRLRRGRRALVRAAGRRATAHAGAPPPMFTPFRLRDADAREPRRRLADGACTARVDGVPDDFHLVHSARARMGGAGARHHRDDLTSRPTGASRPAAPACGTTSSGGLAADRRLRARRTPAPRSRCSSATPGRKGSTRLEWEGANEPLDDGQLAGHRPPRPCP